MLATIDPAVWGPVLAALVGSILGGIVGSWIVAFRMGQWRAQVDGKLQMYEADLEIINSRLGNGSKRFERMSVVQAVQETMREEMKDLKTGWQEERGHLYQRIGDIEKILAALDARCIQTHKRGD